MRDFANINDKSTSKTIGVLTSIMGKDVVDSCVFIISSDKGCTDHLRLNPNDNQFYLVWCDDQEILSDPKPMGRFIDHRVIELDGKEYDLDWKTVCVDVG